MSGVIAIALGRGNIGNVSEPPPRFWQLYSVIFSFVIGSLYGLGVGGMSMITTLVMLCCLRLDIKKAVGAKKVMMFVPAVFATIGYTQHGFLDIALIIAMVIGAGLGGFIGSTWVVKADNQRLKMIFFILVLALSVWSLIHA
ncbi:MAG: sulfite exporter TauE/SafE family protein [Alphaproteobacteria bacterium]|nr:MAG: sulfite exporter TauE/SafE family protein [Alphaproteobacteria bacterium]